MIPCEYEIDSYVLFFLCSAAWSFEEGPSVGLSVVVVGRPPKGHQHRERIMA